MINPFDNREIKTKADLTNIPPLDINPDLMDKLDHLPVDPAFQNEFQVHQDEGPYQPDPAKPYPSFSETLKHYGTETISSLNQDPGLNPLDDTVKSGWNAAADESLFVGIQPKNQSYISQASSPNDAHFRRMAVLKKQEEDEYFDNGSMAAKFLGGFIDSLPFAMIPLGQSFKYASLSKSFYESILSAAPGLGIGSLLHEGTLNANKIGGSIEDTLTSTFIDTISGLAFVGAGVGLGHGFDAMKLYDARNVLKMQYDGIVPEIKVDNEGKVLGYVASPMQGESVSAAKVDEAQKFLDSSFAMNGLFAIPYIGGLLGKGAAKYNPIMRGMLSRFTTIRGVADRVASHSLITPGIEAGREKPEDFETLMGIVRADNVLYSRTLQNLLDQRNEIDPKNSDLSRLAERTKKQWKDEGYITPETFGKEIKESIISGKSSKNAAVNNAVDITREALDDTWKLFREVYGLPKEWMPPPTAEGHFPRVYNQGMMIERPDQWDRMWVSWWKEADQDITKHMTPINEFQERLKVMKENHQKLDKTNATDEQIKTSANELKAAQRKLRKMKEDLADKIRKDKILFLSADDQAGLSGEESRALKKILQPLTKAQKAHKAQKARVEQLKKQEFILNNKVLAATSKRKLQEHKKALSELTAEIKTQEAELISLRSEIDKEEVKLQDKVANKEISPRFYNRIPNSQLVAFKKPKDLLKFRPKFESQFHMEQEAKAMRDTIQNQTPEDTLQQVLGQYIGSASETPTMRRSAMIPDSILQANNFLSNNMPLVVANYRNALQRKIIMKQIFGDVTIDGGFAPITERLTGEFEQEKNNIINNKEMTERAKAHELKKLNKDFNDAKEWLQLTHDRMMGRTRGSQKMREFNRLMRLWTVSTRLGSVPLTMITDLSANIYKHGFWPTVIDGLLPALKNLVARNEDFRENAAHAHLALSHVLAAHNDRDWGGIAMEHVPMTGKLGNFMEHAAHISGNIAMTNQLDNFLQRITANIIQSKIMRYMQKFEQGILEQKDKEKLLKYGLDPEKWSKRFLDGWKERGKDGNGEGGLQSRYWEWSDVEAANKMSRTIYKGVNDTIIRKGLMDAPFVTDDPVIGMIWFLHGWTSAAITRYLVPLMQRPDAEHLTGLMAMLTAGALVSPMRKLSRGESPIDDETNMFWDAMQDSGILSPITDMIENANIIANGRILRGISNDRYRQRSNLGAMMGPVAGIGQDVFRIIGMMIDGRLNENDVKKAARLIPAMQPWYLRGLQNKMIEGIGLPKTAADAESQSANAYNYGV